MTHPSPPREFRDIFSRLDTSRSRRENKSRKSSSTWAITVDLPAQIVGLPFEFFDFRKNNQRFSCQEKNLRMT
jgi:hypothetical protein